MVILIDAEKDFHKIQHYDKNSPERGYKGNILQHYKGLYEEYTVNITLNGEKLKAFPLKSGPVHGCPLLSLLFNVVLEVLALALREEKGRNVIQVGKEEPKLSVFADNMMLYIENLKDTT